ncbi:MAG: DUF2922 domain-containing protein [Firmicutes bacterium]|nr:DUF2922 domain-containing protein [Bacillota bacterium]
MEKTLRLIFRNEEGKSVTMSVGDPQDPLDSEDVDSAMDLIISTDVFQSSGGSIVEKTKAEVVSREVETILVF